MAVFTLPRTRRYREIIETERTEREAAQAQVQRLQEQFQAAQGELTEARQSLVYGRLGAYGTGASSKANRSPFNKVHQGVVLYETYKAIPWIKGPIDVIAQRMTSGGVELEPAYDGASKKHRQDIEDLIFFTNEDEDFVENSQISIKDLFIFAESFWEIDTSRNQPNALFYIDPVGMNVDWDKHGNIKGYKQTSNDGKDVDFDPDQIVYFRLRGPRGRALSPLECLLSPALVWQHIVNWQTKFFENGARPPLWIDLGPKSSIDDIGPASAKFEETFAGANNAHRTLIMAAGATVNPMGAGGPTEFDFLESQKFLRDQMLTVLGVPPAQASSIETGNIGAGTGVSQDKAFRNNTINPVRRLFEEKATYRIIQKGFGYDDWIIRLKEANYDNDELLVNLVRQKVDAGLITPDEARAEMGDNGTLPGGGGDTPSIRLATQVIPASDIGVVHGLQYMHAQELAMNAGLPSDASPADLAKASPKDALSSGDDHPAAQDDKEILVQPNNQPGSDAPVGGVIPNPKGTKPKPAEALADLSLWRRKALKDVKEGRPYRAFRSDTIDPVIAGAVSEMLFEAATVDEVREVFTLAFTDVRGEEA